MGTTEFKEIEFKYDAKTISLRDFKKAVKKLKPHSVLNVEGWDYYFNKKKDFIRYRADEKCPELTVKKKLGKLNNNHRVEVNLKLQTDAGILSVTEMMKVLGFKLNFAIYKRCHIYYFDEVDIVFYTVFDERMKAVGQFLEIEFMESVKGKKVSYALKTIKSFEAKLKELNISPSKRLTKSLLEMFKR